MKIPLLLVVCFLYGSVVDLIDGSSLSKYNDRPLPALVLPKLVVSDDTEDLDQPNIDGTPVRFQVIPSYWAPTLDRLSQGDAEFYRKGVINSMTGREMGRNLRSMSMLRMGRSTDGDKRSMTMLRMGRAFDQSEDMKRSMGMLRMGRALDRDDELRKSMSILRMGRGGTDEDEKRSMGMLRMGRYVGEANGESEGSTGMFRMERSYANKNVDRGALNMLRMGKRSANQVDTETEMVQKPSSSN